MAPRRFATVLPPLSSPRATLSSASHPVVDVILKDLKICTRRIQAALSSHRAELQVLEKLYYKGNNQHRTALFWRRVSGIRRCGRRVDEIQLQEVVERLRQSFWGEAAQQNLKLLKGPWTHVPDVKATRSLLQRLKDCRSLISHSQDRLTSAHDHFNLDLQTGAFLQLILVLTAVASRMHILLEELGLAIDLATDTLDRLIAVLDPDSKLRQPGMSTREVIPGTGSTIAHWNTDALDGEDLGEFAAVHGASSGLQTPTPASEDSIKLPAHPPDFNFGVKEKKVDTIVRSTVVRRTATPEASKAKSSSKRQSDKQPPPKKKRKKDEIDDIFGL